MSEKSAFKKKEEYRNVLNKLRNKVGDTEPEEEMVVEAENEQEFWQALYNHAIRGNAQSAKLYMVAKGWIGNQEGDNNRFEFSAREYTEIGDEVARRLQSEFREGSGVCPICGFSKALHVEPCLDTGREQQEEG